MLTGVLFSATHALKLNFSLSHASDQLGDHGLFSPASLRYGRCYSPANRTKSRVKRSKIFHSTAIFIELVSLEFHITYDIYH